MLLPRASHVSGLALQDFLLMFASSCPLRIERQFEAGSTGTVRHEGSGSDGVFRIGRSSADRSPPPRQRTMWRPPPSRFGGRFLHGGCCLESRILAAGPGTTSSAQAVDREVLPLRVFETEHIRSHYFSMTCTQHMTSVFINFELGRWLDTARVPPFVPAQSSPLLLIFPRGMSSQVLATETNHE